MYFALKFHFKDPKFDFFRYNKQVNHPLSTYKNSKYFFIFEKLSKYYPLENSFQDLVLSNLIENPTSNWPGDLLEDEAKEHLLKWKKRIESLSYVVSEDCTEMLELLELKQKKFNDLFKVPRGSYPPLILLYTQNFIHLETLTIFEDIFSYGKNINKFLKDDFIWEELYLRILKYKPFLQYDQVKIKTILKEKFTR